MTDRPDFFLSSSDSLEWSEPRSCRIVERFPDDYTLVSIDPSSPAGRDEIVLRPRYQGQSLSDVSTGVVTVDMFDADGFTDAHARGAARRQYIGEIYASRDEAERARQEAFREFEFTRGGRER